MQGLAREPVPVNTNICALLVSGVFTPLINQRMHQHAWADNSNVQWGGGQASCNIVSTLCAKSSLLLLGKSPDQQLSRPVLALFRVGDMV